MHSCVREGPAALDWSGLAARKPFELVVASRSLSAAAQPACAMAGYRAVLAVDRSVIDPAAAGRRRASLVSVDASSLFVDASLRLRLEAATRLSLMIARFSSRLEALGDHSTDPPAPRTASLQRHRAPTSEVSGRSE